MKSIYIISDMVNNTPTTKIKKFRFSFSSFLSAEKEMKTTKTDLINYWKWFNSVEEAEQYLEKL